MQCPDYSMLQDIFSASPRKKHYSRLFSSTFKHCPTYTGTHLGFVSCLARRWRSGRGGRPPAVALRRRKAMTAMTTIAMTTTVMTTESGPKRARSGAKSTARHRKERVGRRCTAAAAAVAAVGWWSERRPPEDRVEEVSDGAGKVPLLRPRLRRGPLAGRRTCRMKVKK